MMAIKAGDHDKGISLSGPVACIEVEDSPLDVATPTPKVQHHLGHLPGLERKLGIHWHLAGLSLRSAKG